MPMTRDQLLSNPRILMVDDLYIRFKTWQDQDDIRQIEFVYNTHLVVAGSWEDRYDTLLIPLDNTGCSIIRIEWDDVLAILTKEEALEAQHETGTHQPMKLHS
jgi:hypothetical protein